MHVASLRRLLLTAIARVEFLGRASFLMTLQSILTGLITAQMVVMILEYKLMGIRLITRRKKTK